MQDSTNSAFSVSPASSKNSASFWTPEIIQALTPLFLGTVGCIIGVGALFLPVDDKGRAASAIGLAGTAIAGAAGLAKNESFSVEKKGDNVKVASPGSQASE